ncbi:Oxidoreductase [Melia azedarach]|uniref:Oxidoreductase n=1 Tax=Melia azedarach TaxID=155640 RepID=A0ACC1XLH4_MELAZ|nr:Oxidoreductase [Melia azedarach]
MFSETLKQSSHTHTPTEGDQKHKHKELDHEIRNMVNAITDHITDHHKPGSSLHHHEDDDDDRGVRIITLAGTNSGATMRSELDDKQNPHGVSLGEPEPLSTYVNSNFQAVNNSIMLGSSYNTNDPGVHLDITDVFEQLGQKPEKQHAKKGKKKDKESFKSDQHSEKSD